MRYGQAVYVALHSLRPDLTDRLRETGLDTFDHDERVPGLMDWLRSGTAAIVTRWS